MKLTRKQIQEGLAQTPIEQIILGSQTAKTTRLTAKQKAFAEKVAKGETQAEAYRQTYDTNAKSSTQVNSASKLAKLPHVNATIEAIQASLNAQAYLLPAHLRALAVQRLTELALDSTIKPSDQLKALELIGKMSEVSLFTERKEIIRTNNTEQSKEKLIQSVMLAIQNSKSLTDDKKDSALSLLDEIKQAKAKQSEPITVDQEGDCPGDNDPSAAELDQSAAENDPSAAAAVNIEPPPAPAQAFSPDRMAAPTHTISDKQSQKNGEGGAKIDTDSSLSIEETDPLVDSE